MSSFFNPPASSNTTAPSGGLFGNTASSDSAPKSIFGQTSSTGTSGNPFSGFGSGGSSTPAAGGGLFTSTTTGTQPAGTGLFGSTAQNATTSSGTTGGTFGSGGSLFGSGVTATGPAPSTTTSTLGAFGGGNLFGATNATDQVNKPASTSLFSNPSNSTTAPASGGLAPSLFGPPKTAETPTASSSTTVAPSGGLFGGGLFGKKLDDQAASTTATVGASAAPSALFNLGGASSTSKDATPSAPTGGLFGVSQATKASEKSTAANAPSPLNMFGSAPSSTSTSDKKDAPAAPSLGLFGALKDPSTEKKEATAAPLSLGLFGAPKDTGAEKKDIPSGLGLGQPSTSGDKSKDAQSSALATLSSTVTAANVSVPPPSMLRGKTIEEIVNRWSNDLESHVKEFNKFAGEVAVWDRALVENGNNLSNLYAHVLAAEREQNEIEQALEHIEQQQKDLSSTLDSYEKSTEEILGGQGGSLRALDTGPADNERDKNYMLATELHTHLDDLSGSLTQMIDSVNSLSLSAPSSTDNNSQQGEDAMAQIAQILSSHLESLQWIDGAVREVEGKLVEVERGVREAGGGSGSSGANKSRGFGLR